jgi:dihydropyrimidine dehydrogenase (NAD+) subunit PreA
VNAGADSLSAINAISGIAGVDIETFTPLPGVKGMTAFGGISGPGIKPIALRCTAQLTSLKKPVSAMGGINEWQDALEFFLLGASTVQICTAVMLKGYGIIYNLVSGLEEYLKRKGFNSFPEIIGLALNRIVNFEKIPLDNKPTYIVGPECWLCGDCITACNDGGFQAIRAGKERAIIDKRKCDGCGLCKVVCQVGAIKEVYPDSQY